SYGCQTLTLLSILIHLLYCSILQAFVIYSIACSLSVRTLTLVLYCTNNNTNQIPTNSALVDVGQLTTFRFPKLTMLFSILSIPTHPTPIFPLSSPLPNDLSV